MSSSLKHRIEVWAIAPRQIDRLHGSLSIATCGLCKGTGARTPRTGGTGTCLGDSLEMAKVGLLQCTTRRIARFHTHQSVKWGGLKTLFWTGGEIGDCQM